MLHEEFAPASRPRTESLFPCAPGTLGQLVTLSLYLSPSAPFRFFRSSSFVERDGSSGSRSALSFSPEPSAASFRLLSSLYQHTQTLPSRHGHPFSRFSPDLFRSRSLSNLSLLRFFPLLSRAASASLFGSFSPWPPLPPSLALPVSVSSFSVLVHAVHLAFTRIFSPVVSQTLRSFLGNWIESHPPLARLQNRPPPVVSPLLVLRDNRLSTPLVLGPMLSNPPSRATICLRSSPLGSPPRRPHCLDILSL